MNKLQKMALKEIMTLSDQLEPMRMELYNMQHRIDLREPNAGTAQQDFIKQINDLSERMSKTKRKIWDWTNAMLEGD